MTEIFIGTLIDKLKDISRVKQKKRELRSSLYELVKENFISDLKVGKSVPKVIVQEFMELLYERKEFSIYADSNKHEYHFHEEEEGKLLHIYMQYKRKA